MGGDAGSVVGSTVHTTHNMSHSKIDHVIYMKADDRCLVEKPGPSCQVLRAKGYGSITTAFTYVCMYVVLGFRVGSVSSGPDQDWSKTSLHMI